MHLTHFNKSEKRLLLVFHIWPVVRKMCFKSGLLSKKKYVKSGFRQKKVSKWFIVRKMCFKNGLLSDKNVLQKWFVVRKMWFVVRKICFKSGLMSEKCASKVISCQNKVKLWTHRKHTCLTLFGYKLCNFRSYKCMLLHTLQKHFQGHWKISGMFG